MSNKAQINEMIAALKYDPKTVMVFNGTQIANADFPVEDRLADGTYTVITREKCSYESSNMDIAVPSSYNDITYPGALLVADNALLDGKPQELAAEKAPLKITLNLSGTENISFVAVPTYGNVQAGINKLIADWFDKAGHDWSLPANLEYHGNLIYDENELALKFGCDVSRLKQKLGIDFSLKRAEKKSIYIVHFKQIFYTASAERPVKPADLFGESTTWKDLEAAGLSNAHPPLLVKDVQYGRQVFLKLESTLTSTELEEIIKANVTAKGVEVKTNESANYKSKLDKVDISLVVLGGSDEVYTDLSFNKVEDVQKINKILFENAKFSRTNQAAPLNYSAIFLKDGVSAGVFGKTEYVTEKCASFENGELELHHTGAYVARFNVTWKEQSYENGVKKLVDKGWENNGRNYTAPYKGIISLPANARAIHIKAEGATGLIWEWWRTSCDKPDLPLVPYRKLSIGGTTLNQTCSITTQP